MKDRLEDFWECVLISLKVFVVLFLIGILIGGVISLSRKAFDYTLMLEWTYKLGIYLSCFGLFLVAISMSKPSLMGDLNHMDKWRLRFLKFGFTKVVAYCSILLAIYAFVLQYVVDFVLRA